MAQLPATMRRKRAAISSIHEPKPTLQDKLKTVGSWLLLVVAMAVLAVGCYAFYRVMTDAHVAELKVVGTRSAAETQQVMQHVLPQVTQNYFTSNLTEIRDKTLELSWVDRVVVSRAWPNAIRVRVIPHHPIARWGTGRLLSDSGIIFSEVSPKNNNDLPLLHGPLAQSSMMMRRYNEINQLFIPLDLRLTELYLTERMTWFMQFDSGLRVIVDQDQTMGKLQRLSYLAEHDLQTVWPRITAIDLRYRNGLAIQWKNSQPVKIANGNFVVTSNDTNVAQANKPKP